MCWQLQQISALTTLDLSGCQLSGPALTCLCTKRAQDAACKPSTGGDRAGKRSYWEHASALGWGGVPGLRPNLKESQALLRQPRCNSGPGAPPSNSLAGSGPMDRATRQMPIVNPPMPHNMDQ